jgi:hypothetical protein
MKDMTRHKNAVHYGMKIKWNSRLEHNFSLPNEGSKLSCVADPDHFDPDPTFHFDAVPDPTV